MGEVKDILPVENNEFGAGKSALRSDDDEVIVLVCGPYGSLYSFVPGSIVARCEICGERVMVSPAGQKAMSKAKHKISCIPCAHQTMTENPNDVEIKGVVEGYEDDLKTYLNQVNNRSRN